MFISALSIESLRFSFVCCGLTIIVLKWEIGLGHGEHPQVYIYSAAVA